MKYETIEGWFSQTSAESLKRYIETYNIKTVLEIGTFKGKSAAFFAELCENVTVVDPFILWPDAKERLGWKEEEHPSFYDDFVKNMEALGLRDKITIYTDTSENASKILDGITYDLIYIDAQHDFESVDRDINLWKDRTTKIICGDDHDENWPDVQKAVNKNFNHYEVNGNLWAFIK